MSFKTSYFSQLRKINILLILFVFNPFNLFILYAQNPAVKTGSSEYSSLYDQGKYNEALKIILPRLNAINAARVKVPKHDYSKDYILNKSEEDKNNISVLFNKRKAGQFFIEDNKELFELHLYAARCYYKTGEGDASLNHYLEALRFNPTDLKKDEIIFYEISQVYKSLSFLKAYTDSLETAYSFNPSNYEYSLELGKALSKTNEKKKAIYHLKRYVESKDEEIADPGIFLILGNLNEDTGNYIDTVYYYKKYLEKKPEDGNANFALGYVAFARTGDHNLALDCFRKAVQYLPQNDIFRRSKSAEYEGDIYFKDLEYEKAIESYLETKKYHESIKIKLEENKNAILKLDDEIRKIKSSLSTQDIGKRYGSYEKLEEEKGKLELIDKEMKYAYNKINAGKIRWNTALSYERLEKLDQAIQYYNEAISYNYNTDAARERIKKLKLKINRGY